MNNNSGRDFDNYRKSFQAKSKRSVSVDNSAKDSVNDIRRFHERRDTKQMLQETDFSN
jgi:hypothetical protein